MPYSGGKQRLAARIIQLMPDHKHYVEPFAGALSVLLGKPVSLLETVNDLDGEITTFWRVLRDQPEELERRCALTPHSRALYMAARAPGQGGTDVEIAWRVWVRLSQGMGSRSNGTGGWRYAKKATGMSLTEYLTGYVARIAPAAERLHHVSLEATDAVALIPRYDSIDTLFYVDPPYLSSTRYAGMYAVEMGGALRHQDLLGVLKQCRGSVILSGYRSELYDHELTGWTRVDLATTAMTGENRVECLWLNYEPPTQPNPGLL
jgi:DNA adenine methylase